MGLFDYVRCEIPLPDGFTGELQTKDIDDPFMNTHIITKDGRLMMEVLVRTESVPKSERPFPDAEEGSPAEIYGSVRFIREQKDANFHGLLNFYGGGGSEDWHEYEAKFTDGQLVSIRRVDA